LSTLTKVFALLVSLLAIFLCGVVVVFVTNSQNWKELYEEEQTLRAAAQVHAQVAEDAQQGLKTRLEALIQRLNDDILALEQENFNLVRQWSSEAQARVQADRKSMTMVELSKSLQSSNHDMYTAQNAIQKSLQEAHRDMIAAQTQSIELSRQLDSERVKSAQLETIRRRSEEKIHELQNEIAMIRQRLEQVTVASSELRSGMDRVTAAQAAPVGVSIRGEITEIDDNRAAISVGSSSGVRKDMQFKVIRGDKYLGSLTVTHVLATEAAGWLTGRQGPVVVGDKVTTGFD